MADTTAYLSGGRIQGRSDDSVTTAIAQTSWKVIARATMNGDNADLDTGTGNGTTNNCVVTENTMYGTPKTNIMIIAHIIPSTSGAATTACDLTFNGDNNDNYIKIASNNGGSDGTPPSSGTSLIDCRYNSNQDTFIIGHFRNEATNEKLGTIHTAHEEPDAGSGSVPDRREIVAKWANTANQINRVKFNKGSSFVNIASGSELIILGCDDDEADSGTNFWQELANPTDLAVAGNTLDSGEFTSKKFLKVDVFRVRSGAVNSRIRVNGDTGQHYSHRNFGASSSYNTPDGETDDGTSIHTHALTTSGTFSYTTYYIVNKLNREKLMIIHEVNSNTAGNNVPHRMEVVAKWTEDELINEINVINTDTGNLGIGTSIRVWGSD